ncbi:acyl-CoA dehydrogenase [Aquisediminimonas sediminicola]|uniref:acyl-CoA dehydrogenase n=1 Tax=Alteraquisediminimonas sediminicola TaxID=2676787 RepID=UPI001C8DF072|nr:acyl-CoA dehydrogenase [Aquisediminimonas sediminicola]
MTYRPVTREQVFALEVSAGIDELAQCDYFSAASPDMVKAIVEGAGQFAQGEFAPLNRIGDVEGARLLDGKVCLPDGYFDAYRAFVAQGWNSIFGPVEFGGQDLPFSLAVAALESLGTANLAMAMIPNLTLGAMEALHMHGNDAQKALYLPKLISGKWSGTMNLTEPHAGSDVGALRTTATPIAEGPDAGKYLIKGTKIFISWGDHELAENIIHLVLARLPGAPAGSRGISLFVVPRYRPTPDGRPGSLNDVKAVSLEHKLGLRASPTCVMSYGDNDACVGELVGAENEGLKCMFTMMNSARITVAAQGVMIAEAAQQKAAAYARERIQSARAGSADKNPVPIVQHPDVRRMLLRMRALTEGARALLYHTCGQVDRAALNEENARLRADLLVPLAKSWCTDISCEVAGLGVQVHGGMGFIEETGAAQYWRDARILPIYEGTNGIQAADLVNRKLVVDGGAALAALMADIERDAHDSPELAGLARDCAQVAKWMLDRPDIDDRLAGSVAFCTMCAVAVAGWQLLRQAEVAGKSGGVLSRTKPAIARYFIEHIVPEARGLMQSSQAGAELLYALSDEELTDEN